jgi:hypothetical protein
LNPELLRGEVLDVVALTQPEGWVSATGESHHALSEILATMLDARLNLQEHIAIDASLI